MSKAQGSILNTLIHYARRHSHIVISQEWLATVSGISREHVNRLIKKFVRWGFITHMGRYWKTSVYRIAPFIRTTYFKNRFKDILPALIFFFSLSLLSCQPSFSQKDHTMNNNNEVIYKKDYLTRERDTICEVFFLPKNQQGLKIYDLSEDYTPIHYKKELEEKERVRIEHEKIIEWNREHEKKRLALLEKSLEGNYWRNLFRSIGNKAFLKEENINEPGAGEKHSDNKTVHPPLL